MRYTLAGIAGRASVAWTSACAYACVRTVAHRYVICLCVCWCVGVRVAFVWLVIKGICGRAA
jgi:hypothetical protein